MCWASSWTPLWLFLCFFLTGINAFNLDVDNPTVYSGPEGSYFGYSVDFHRPTSDHSTMSVLVGAPKANTTQPKIVEAGAVYYCPWPPTDSKCRQIAFDSTNNRMMRFNDTRQPVEFKSNQWFGATVRTHKGKVVACAPLYHWSALKMPGEKDPVGTCYIAIQNFSAYVEYSPCRSGKKHQTVCQLHMNTLKHDGTLVVGGPGSYYWQGQIITTGVAEILNGYSVRELIRKVKGEKQSGAAPDSYDDSYLGKLVTPNQSDVYTLLFFSIFLNPCYRLDDILVGAPLYMDREFESKPKEVGRVYIYLQEDALTFKEPIILSGTEVFGRFGSAIANLGDLNQDGYQDFAVGAPFAGADRRGRVFIYNGVSEGLKLQPSQVLDGVWASKSAPGGFGFSLRGDSDLDKNDYPDLIVGAFGAGKAIVYRSRPVVTVDAQLLLNPMIVNPENKTCHMTARVCATVSGHGIPHVVDLLIELNLDWLKQKGAIKRVLFLDTHQHQQIFRLRIENRNPQKCQNFIIYLRDETEFRDKLTPISINLNYSLDESSPPRGLALKPILNYYEKTSIQEQAYILVDCGDDNMCVPDLRLSAAMDSEKLIIGEDNPLMITINAQNQGEGAYEAELYVIIPPEADYIGVERKNEALRRLNCEYRMENVTRMVVCDLGNPMVAATNISVGLRFAVQRLEEAGSNIKFDLQIKSSNKDNANSNLVTLRINITALAQVEIRGVSHPAQILLPLQHWEPKEKPTKEEDIGPQVQHIYELHNKGPSAISKTFLQVDWPSHHKDEMILYVFEVKTEGPITCKGNATLNPLNLETSELEDTPELLGFLRNSSLVHSIKKREINLPRPQPLRQYNGKILNCSNINCLLITCHIGRLDKGQSAVVKVRSRLWAQTFLQLFCLPKEKSSLKEDCRNHQVEGSFHRIGWPRAV
uniref:Integrin subunit alpha 8 n=1 Tax=Erpetoichthys calabaricus TaxID=27687 RepID=A0A8C4SYB3_ERPCA